MDILGRVLSPDATVLSFQAVVRRLKRRVLVLLNEK